MPADPKESLLLALRHFGLIVTGEEQAKVFLAGGYTIEVEGPALFKLLQGGQVVAPFADLDELCQFIQLDLRLNA